MRNINRVQLLGHLGADPEIRNAGNARVAHLRLATTSVWKDRDGERQESTEWHRVELWISAMIDLVERYLTKGSRIYVEGTLKTRKWVDQKQVERWYTSVSVQPYSGCLILLDSPGFSTEKARKIEEPKKGEDSYDGIPF